MRQESTLPLDIRCSAKCFCGPVWLALACGVLIECSKARPLLRVQVLTLAPDVGPLYLLRVGLLSEGAAGRRTEGAMVDYATALHLQARQSKQ